MTSSWGGLFGKEFTIAINEAYAPVVHWRPNLFKVPSGASGKQFVAEFTLFLMLLPWSLTWKELHSRPP